MDNYFIFRTSGVIGRHGNNFATNILNSIRFNNELNVVDDQFIVPTSTSLISKVINDCINQIKKGDPWEPGIYNLTPKGKSNWFEISNYIIEIAFKKNLPFIFEEIKVNPIMTFESPDKAKRPKYSLLDISKLQKKLNYELPYWQDDLIDIIRNLSEKIKSET